MELEVEERPGEPAPGLLSEEPNRHGRTRAMTVFTPIRPWYRPPGGTLWVRMVFWFARRSLRRPNTIQELSFIHFARWGILRRIPDHGQPRERLRQPLLMFQSNYNGTFDQYIGMSPASVRRCTRRRSGTARPFAPNRRSTRTSSTS